MMNQIIRQLPYAKYDALPGVRSTHLNTLAESCPAKLRWSMEHPKPSTPGLAFGAAFHAELLQPSLNLLRIAPDVDRRTKDGKAAYQAFMESVTKEQHAVNGEDAWTIGEMVKAIRSHPIAGKLLEIPEQQAELTLCWDDADTGLPCKARLDAFGAWERKSAIIDVKTTLSAHPDAFARSIFKYGYFRQAAHGLNGANAMKAGKRDYFYIAVEKEPPFLVAVYRLKREAVEFGATECRMYLELFKYCQDSGEWPAYGQGVSDIGLPAWAKPKESDNFEDAMEAME